MPSESSSNSPAELLLARLLLAIEDGEAVVLRDWLLRQPEVQTDPARADAVLELHARLLSARGAILPEAQEGRWWRGLGYRVGETTIGGEFELVRFLGAGGMGEVWEAREARLDRSVALKLMRPDSLGPTGLERFSREARAGARLSHPGIVMTLEHRAEGDSAWIALELVPGGRTLRHFIAERTLLDPLPSGHDREVARLVAEIADALAFAHGRGVIHRDVKPGNVLMTPEGRPKVTDFGLAQIQDDSLTGDDVLGTYAYMSPEQVKAEKTAIDHRTDVFSLGVVLYELLTLRKPFQGDTRVQVASKILLEDPPDPRTIRSRIPADLAVIVGKTLEKDRDERFPSMVELAADLRRHLANEPIRANPPTRTDRLLKWTKRHPAKTASAAIAAVTSTVITVLLVVNVRTNRALEAKSAESELRRVAAEEALGRETTAADLARGRRAEVLRLSALQDLKLLLEEADQLWPAEPDRIGAFQDWIDRARPLVSELPAHRATHSTLEGLEDRDSRWWRSLLEELIAALEDLKAGFLSPEAVVPGHGWSIPRRLAFATELRADFAPGGRHERAWREAESALREGYPGLDLEPQQGLVPLGPDPHSGLWEFAHLASGEPARRSADGTLEILPETGVVLVLLPGGSYLMGAQSGDPEGPCFDARGKGRDTPPQLVNITPFFISKFELNHSQWIRACGEDPSLYGHFPVIEHCDLFPVDSVSWDDCASTARRLDLELPSEAQWRYANRAGSNSIWWTGDNPEDLQYVANLADQSLERSGGGLSWRCEPWDDEEPATAPIGRFEANLFGLHDTCGNVAEWCRDVLDDYYFVRKSDVDPVLDYPDALIRLALGGAFNSPVWSARSAARESQTARSKSGDIGWRPARRVDRAGYAVPRQLPLGPSCGEFYVAAGRDPELARPFLDSLSKPTFVQDFEDVAGETLSTWRAGGTTVQVSILDGREPLPGAVRLVQSPYFDGPGVFLDRALLCREETATAGAIELRFDRPVEAVGAWLFDDFYREDDWTLSVTEIDGSVHDLGPIALSPGLGLEGFVGFRSCVGITRFEIAISDGVFELDHVHVGSPLDP